MTKHTLRPHQRIARAFAAAFRRVHLHQMRLQVRQRPVFEAVARQRMRRQRRRLRRMNHRRQRERILRFQSRRHLAARVADRFEERGRAIHLLRTVQRLKNDLPLLQRPPILQVAEHERIKQQIFR